MALTDPQSIKISGTTTSLPRVSTSGSSSTYESSDGLIKVSLASQNGNRKRQTWRVDVNKFTTDPFIPAQNVKVSMSFYIVFDRPATGYSNAEALATAVGAIEALTSTENKVLNALLGGQS
ncbi:TPA_asm: coat protein [ssRNA phage Gerhypos.1_19]|uniref:Coat protein n=2 Tax=Leviviricetes TaxID=2842243 RepID=A0A8S5L1X9_9VIRU|nr:coat protein [ssRNA phage Gerhypos.1_19]QDH89120.1 MAG: hypothetical protein H1Bulk29340_000003 [Leviviridae sp.]DAD51608.1 TPA_asm: coat protein [ssRNA phage Gerhypos.1_19]